MKFIFSLIKNIVFIIGCLIFAGNMCEELPVKAALADNNQIVETDDFMDYSQAASALTEDHNDIMPEDISELNKYYTKRLIVQGKDDSIPFEQYSAESVIKGPDNVTILQFSTEKETIKCMADLNKNPNVEYVEPDLLYGLESNFVIKKQDVLQSKEASTKLGTKSTYKSWGVKKVEGDKYSKFLKKSNKEGIIVAVIDSGVSEHKFLKGRIADGGYDFVDRDRNPSDQNGHGTHVAGTIVDCTPNLKVKILPVRALNRNGVGSVATIANAIKYAVDKGAKVINMSLGGGHSQYIENAVNYAIKKGVVVVVAAGNEFENVQNSCPGHIKKCITVAAIDSKEKHADFSNFGSTIDVSGPGVDILSCIPGGGYVYASGTSMASPHIAAVAAMVKLCYPKKSPSEIEKIVCNISKDLGTPGWDRYFGFGLPKLTKVINAKKIKLNQTTAKIMKNTKFKLTATVTPGGFVNWKSSDSKIAAVDEDGLVTGKKIGKTTITATTVNGLKSSCSLTVISDKIPEVKPDKITLDKTKVTMQTGQTLTLNGTIEPEDATVKDITWTSSDEVVANVSKYGTITAYHSGKTIITATTANGITAACQVTVTGNGIFPTKVSLNQKEIKVLIGDILPIWATILPETATDKRLKWSCDNDNLVIDENGKIKAVKEGTSVIRVTTMNSLYDECKVTIIDPKNVINPKGIKLSQTSARLAVDEIIYLFATVTPSNATDPSVIFSSSNSLIADVTPEGIIIGKVKGYATITAKTSNGLKATCSVYVTDKDILPEQVIIDLPEVTMYKNEIVRVMATVLPAGAADKKVTWSSKDKTIAEVDNYGYIYANKVGTTTITAKTSNGVTGNCVVTVKEKPILPITVSISNYGRIEAEAGKTVALNAVIYPENATDKTLTWSSNDKSIALVDDNGVVTGVKEGSARITVKTSNGKTASCTVYIKPGLNAAEGITLNQKELLMKPNDKAVLIATVTPAAAADKKVTFESDNPFVADVSSDGTVTAYKEGTAVIRAKTTNGLTAACTVTVKLSADVPVIVTLNYNQLELEAGKTAILTALVTPESTVDKAVTFTSSDPLILNVDSSGLITAYKSGVAVVTATTSGGVSAACTVTVKDPLITAQSLTFNKYKIPVIKFSINGKEGFSCVKKYATIQRNDCVRAFYRSIVKKCN